MLSYNSTYVGDLSIFSQLWIIRKILSLGCGKYSLTHMSLQVHLICFTEAQGDSGYNNPKDWASVNTRIMLLVCRLFWKCFGILKGKPFVLVFFPYSHTNRVVVQVSPTTKWCNRWGTRFVGEQWSKLGSGSRDKSVQWEVRLLNKTLWRKGRTGNYRTANLQGLRESSGAASLFASLFLTNLMGTCFKLVV